MKWLHEGKWITGGFIVTLVVTGAVSFTSYQNSVQLVNSARQVQQTNQLLDALTDISALLSDAESRQWSYIVSNDPDELTQYTAAVEQLRLALDKLRRPLADTFVQQQRLAALEILINRRLDLFERAIARYRSEYPLTPTDPFIAHAQSNLDQIRQIIAELEQKEEELIAIQLEAVSSNSRTRMVIEPVGTVLTFTILLGVFGMLYRQLLKRQRAEALQQALTQEKELSELRLQLFSMVSHEFRTPLSLILGSSQLLEEGLKKTIEPARLKSLYRIQSSAKMMTQLLNDILMLARANAGELEFNPKWTEIQTFCLNLIEDFQVSHPAKRSLCFTQHGDRTHVCVDEKLLYSILSNLLSNAAKFSPQNSTIYFTLSSQSDGIQFQVRDQGIGVLDGDRARLYEPFNRGKNVKETKGTGLGLAVVQRCLALHGGTIAMVSQVGVGTTFTVTIPQTDAPLDSNSSEEN
ncbi:MAG: histidine kinase [Leptolyngbyaceae cyanobacterium SL_7_1]|nr:histidine kinase [Leptolyngbyaceae cyanobacterium SL_7_1]